MTKTKERTRSILDTVQNVYVYVPQKTYFMDDFIFLTFAYHHLIMIALCKIANLRI